MGDVSKIRLEAWKNHPAYFLPSKDETAFSDSDWRERLGNANAASFGLFAGEELIGISGVVRENGNPNAERAILVGSYIVQSFRRQGLSERLFQVRMEWARKQRNMKTLVLEHREDNLAIQKSHEKFGFKRTGMRDQMWPDGTRAASLIYELKI